MYHKHIGCYAIIIKSNKIAVVKKSRGAYTNKYDLPGGSFEENETPLETLKREIKEELGVEVSTEELFDATAASLNWQREDETIEALHHIAIIYKATLKDNNIKEIPDGHDSLGASWKKISDLNKNNTSAILYIELKKLGYIKE